MKLTYVLAPLGILLALTIVSAILMLLSIGRFAQYWNDQNNRVRINGALLYVALGDSAAQGLGATSPRRGYVGLVADKLSEQKDQPVHVINLSKSGATIRDVIEEQLDELSALEPNVITLDIGGNDIRTYDAGRFERDMDDLMSRLPKQTIISDLPYFGGRDRFLTMGQSERHVVEANTIMRRLADKHGFELVDLHAETQARNAWPWSYAIDYFHPNNFGYKAWADAFLKKMLN